MYREREIERRGRHDSAKFNTSQHQHAANLRASFLVGSVQQRDACLQTVVALSNVSSFRRPDGAWSDRRIIACAIL